MASWKRSRLLKLLMMGLCLIALALAYNSFFLARPVGSGPAGPSVDLDAFRKVWSQRSVVVLGIGDSITAGLGAKSLDHSYFQRLIDNPADEFDELRGASLRSVLPNLSPVNIAVSGSTSLQHSHMITERLSPFDESVFGLVVMTTGGNDIIHNYGRSPAREGAMYGATLKQADPWIQSFEPRLAHMLDSIELLFPGGCEIYLADIYDPTDGQGDAPSVFLPDWPDGLAIHAAYNRVLRLAANDRANVCIVPLHATFLGHGSHCRQFWKSTYDASDPHYWYFDNIEDPNDRGYDAIRRVFLNSILTNSSLRGL